MKKVLLVLAMIALTFSMNAQLNYDKWQVVVTTDEFGDPTGESVSRIFCKGVFSNSATSNSELIVKFVNWGDAMTLDLYEYGRTPGASLSYKSAFGMINIKKDDGTVVKVKAFANKDGGLYFSENNYTSLMEVINGDSTVLKIQFDERDFGLSGSSSYSFKLNN
jgi:hypothetical protein